MVPFICDELQNVYIKLLKMIVYRSNVDEINGPRSLLAIEFNKDTLMEPQSGKYPTASISALNVLKPDALQKKNIMKDFRTIIQAILKKMTEKSPLNHELVKNASCISPSSISQKKKTSISKFGKLVTMMYENNDLTADEADKAKDQFESFIASEVKTFEEEFSKFDTVKYRLQAFYVQTVHRNEKYSSPWKVMVFVFTLSHGQAQIERGFNINSDLLVENMLPPSIIAQRRVYDYLNSLGVSPHDYQIKNDLRIQCMNVHSKYKEYCKEKKKVEEVSEKEEKLNGLLANNETIK